VEVVVVVVEDVAAVVEDVVVDEVVDCSKIS
jgi:hypothetical protein